MQEGCWLVARATRRRTACRLVAARCTAHSLLPLPPHPRNPRRSSLSNLSHSVSMWAQPANATGVAAGGAAGGSTGGAAGGTQQQKQQQQGQEKPVEERPKEEEQQQQPKEPPAAAGDDPFSGKSLDLSGLPTLFNLLVDHPEENSWMAPKATAQPAARRAEL